MVALIVALVIGGACIVAGIIWAIIQSKKVAPVIKPIYALILTLFLALFALICPLTVVPTQPAPEESSEQLSVEREDYDGFTGFISQASLTFISSFQIFTLDADLDNLMGRILVVAENNDAVRNIYGCALMTSAVLARIYTLWFVLSFLKSFTAEIWFSFCKRFQRLYIFSDMTEKSFTMALSIKEKHKDARIVFASAKSAKKIYEDIDSFRSSFIDFDKAMKVIKPVVLKKEILELNLAHCRYAPALFLCNNNEFENVTCAMAINEKYNDPERNFKDEKAKKIIVKKLVMYVFVCKPSNIKLLSGVSPNHVITILKNESREFVYDHLYNTIPRKLIADSVRCNDTDPDFLAYNSAVQNAASPSLLISHHIHIAIIGMGSIGMEMLKTLLCFFQIPGHFVEIEAFDMEKDIESTLNALMPAVFAEKNNLEETDAPHYRVNIHQEFDIMKIESQKKLQEMKDLNYIFISLGDDDKNIDASVIIADLFSGYKNPPEVECVVYNKNKSSYRRGARRHINRVHVSCPGNISDTFSENMLFDSVSNKLYAKAFKLYKNHNAEGSLESFWKNDYYEVGSYLSAAIFENALDIMTGLPQHQYAGITDELLDKTRQYRKTVYERAENY